MEKYNKNFQKSYKIIQKNIHNILSNRIKTIVMNEDNSPVKQILNKNIEYDIAFKYMEKHFKKLKVEMPYLYTFQLYDKNGISLMSMDKKNKYKDDLKLFRPSVNNIVKNPRPSSYFENGRKGLLFIVVEPIYDNKELLGFIEIGINQRFFINRIKQFYSLNSYIFIKNDLYNIVTDENKLKNIKIVFGDYRFFSRYNLPIDILKTIPVSYDLSDDKKFIFKDKTLMSHTTDIKDFEGKTIGKILSFHDFTKIQSQYKSFLFNSFAIAIFILVILILILNKSYLVLTKKIDKYLYILDKSKDSIFVIDINTKNLIFVNQSAQVSLGYTKKELLNLKLEQFSIPLNAGDKLITIENIIKIKESKQSYITRAYNRSINGDLTPVEISFSYVKKDGEYLVAICHNISKQLDNEIKDKANDKIINQYIPISQTNLDGDITYVNDAFCELTKYDKDELLGQNHRLIKHPDTKQSLYVNLWDTISKNESWNGVMRNITKEDNTIWTQVRIEPMYNNFNKKIGYISTRDDISDKKELEYMSDHDLLTKAKNRRSFERELHKQIKNAHRFKDKESDFGLVMFDIDFFKNVNDTYGHHIGDLVLTNLAEAIHLNIRESDIFARWGGEEFIVLCPHSSIEDLKIFVDKLRDALLKTNFLPVPSVTASFGITLFDINDTVDSIQKRVDEALYEAKSNGRDRYEVK